MLIAGRAAMLMRLLVPPMIRFRADKFVRPFATDRTIVELVSPKFKIGAPAEPAVFDTTRSPLLTAIELEPLPVPETIEFARTLPPLTTNSPKVFVAPAPPAVCP